MASFDNQWKILPKICVVFRKLFLPEIELRSRVDNLYARCSYANIHYRVNLKVTKGHSHDAPKTQTKQTCLNIGRKDIGEK